MNLSSLSNEDIWGLYLMKREIPVGRRRKYSLAQVWRSLDICHLLKKYFVPRKGLYALLILPTWYCIVKDHTESLENVLSI